MDNAIGADIRFSITPEWVLDSDISDRAIRIYAILARYADSETLQAFPSRETLAKRARTNAKAVTKAIDELVAIGAVVKQHRKNGDAFQSNLYTLRRVGPNMTLGSKLTPGVGSESTLGRVPDDPLTITTERKPKERYKKPLRADDYRASPELLETLASKYEGLNIQEELEKFRDYHAAKGSKFDIWDRAFQRWVRQAWEWSPAAKEVRARRAVEEELERYKRENGVE